MPLGFEKFSLKGDKQDVYPAEKLQENVKVAPVSSNGNGKEAPPSYAVNDPVNNDAPPGPSAEELNAAFANLKLSDTPPPFPTPDHCLAHLKLISAFHVLKEDVGYTDGLFNLWDAKCELVDGRDEALARMREKRWALYVARAVERFEVWWLKVLCQMENSQRLQGKEMVANNLRFMEFTRRGKVTKWTTSMLPPIGMYP